MAYVALYRRWRPQNFASLVGQQAVKQALTNALASGRIAHAYLFAGPRGTGKTSTARILAKALNCEQGPTPEPCGKCGNCLYITDGSSMDVFEIDAASNRGIDEIKALREQLAFNPVDGRYKVYIIDEVHMLTTEAFNALLKTLEEPPAHVIFILATTDPQRIPATIHSRCQRFDFRRVTTDEIAEHLAMVAENSGLAADSEALRLIAIQSEGGMRDALSLLDQCGVMGGRITAQTVRDVLGIVGREALRELVRVIGRQQLPEALEQLRLLLEQGKDARQIMTELAEYLRALLLFKAAPQYGEAYLTDTEEALASLAPLFGQERLLAAEERLHAAMLELKNTMRPRITAELCIFDLCRMEGSTVAALAARIERLEQKLAHAAQIPQMAANDAGKAMARPAAAEPENAFVRPAAKAAQAQQMPAEQGSAAASGFAQGASENASAQAGTEPKRELSDNSKTSAQAAAMPASARQEVPAVRGAAFPPPPAAPAAIISASEPLAENTGDVPLGEEYWKKTLAYLNGEKKISMVSCAKWGRVTAFANGVLQVTFKSAFQCERMKKEDYKRAFEDVLLRLTRQAIRLECVAAGSRQKAARPPVQEKASAKALPGIVEDVLDKAEGAAAELPPHLRRAVEVLGGTVETLP